VDIGPPKRIIEVEPVTLPLPDELSPEPVSAPAPEPEPGRTKPTT
jgi:hypothetical protein